LSSGWPSDGAGLVAHAPIYWRLAVNAARAHRRYLGYLLTKAGGIGSAPKTHC
jgi:hypothetical protein